MTNAPAIPGPVDVAAPLFIVINVGSGADDLFKTRDSIDGVLAEAGRGSTFASLERPHGCVRPPAP